MKKHNRKYKVSDILKTSGIFHFDSEKTLSKVLPKLTSTHDAAFIFDKKDKFIGIISSYYLFKKRSFNLNSKLKNVAVMPTKLKLSDNLSQVAEKMINTKIYYLPVLNSKFEGIVSINRLFNFVIKNKLLNHGGRLVLSNRKLITIKKGSSINETLNLMNKEKVDKLPVVGDNGKLEGFISRFDLKDLVKNPDTEHRSYRATEKQSELEEKIDKYMQTRVFKIEKIPDFSQAHNLMMRYKVGSLLITDRENRPMSIVTKRDLLTTISACLP